VEASFWEVLGIAQTNDERAIKRAFATRLRITSPESDPAGYMKLREAFEAAKQFASMQRHYESSEEPADEPGEAVEAPQEVVPVNDPPASPQVKAFAELQTLLSERRLDDFLHKIESIRDSQIFATLDEQHDFIGEVACLVQEAEIEDATWRGRLASLLGAREHDNIFSQGSRYWYAYGALLRSYAEARVAATQAHAGTQDEVAATPGYLHVYHVLTAPFDSERLSALTRSRTYHRLAENLLERSRVDPAIVIPTENRDWWERTAMAGQHRPVEEPAAVANPAPAGGSSGFPLWPIFIVLMLILNVARTCNSESTTRKFSSEQARSYLDLVPRDSRTISPALPLTGRIAFRRLAFCDPETRAQLIEHMRKTQRDRATVDTPAADDSDPLKFLLQLQLDENDPVVAALLAKCQPPK
jgi:hypothetical protein